MRYVYAEPSYAAEKSYDFYVGVGDEYIHNDNAIYNVPFKSYDNAVYYWRAIAKMPFSSHVIWESDDVHPGLWFKW